MKKMMHLNGFMIFSPMNHSVGSWLHPDSQVAGSFAKPALWQDLARTLERGKFDAIFFADTLAAFGNYRNRMDEALTHAIQFPVHDPTLVIPMLAAVTERLGFAATLSVTYYEPYMAVRKFGTLDHLTNGRIGWNIVTSAHVAEAVNLGHEKMVPHQRALPSAQTNTWTSATNCGTAGSLTRLWQTNRPACLSIPAKSTRLITKANGSRVPVFRPSNHRHRAIRCLFQAGASEAGRDFCAKHAEAAFGVQLTTRALKAYADDMQQRLKKFGRDPASLKYIWGIQTILGGTEEEAKRKHQEFNELVPYEGGLALLSGHSNHDLSQYDIDEPIEDIEVEGIQGLLDIFTKMYKAGDLGKDKLTMREVGKIYGATIGCPQIVGTPEQVADQMEAIHR